MIYFFSPVSLYEAYGGLRPFMKFKSIYFVVLKGSQAITSILFGLLLDPSSDVDYLTRAVVVVSRVTL